MYTYNPFNNKFDETVKTASGLYFDGTYLASVGITGVTETQTAVDAFAEAMVAYIATLDATYLAKAGLSGGQTAAGGTASSDDLTLKANTAAWSSANTGVIDIKNSLITFTGQTSVAQSNFTRLIEFSETVSISGLSVGSLIGFYFLPTIQQDTSLTFALMPAFQASPTLQPTVGGISDGSAATFLGFSSGVKHSLAHSGSAGTTTNMAGFADGPQFVRASGTGTHTITNYDAFSGFNPLLFQNHINTGYTVTTARTVHAKNPSNSGGTLTNNVGIDVDALSSGTNNYGVRIAKANTYSLYLSDTGGTSAGGITWGADTNLYRSAANTLKTDDTLVIGNSAIFTAVSGGTTSGQIWNDTTQHAIAAYEAGIKQMLVGTIFTATADKTVANTTTETSIIGTGVGTLTLPANFFVAGKTVKFHIHGYHSASGSPNITIKVKLGSTVITSATVASGSGTTDGFDITGEVTCRTTGASGTFVGTGVYSEQHSSGALEGLVNTSASSIDTTTSQVLDVTITWGTASTSNTLTSQTVEVAVIN